MKTPRVFKKNSKRHDEDGSVLSATPTTPAASVTTHRFHSNTNIHNSVMLRRTPSLMSRYQTTSISKHYRVNEQIRVAFFRHYEHRQHNNNIQRPNQEPSSEIRKIAACYALGMQFLQTALLEIPKHGYYYSARHEKERMESALEAVKVANILVDLIEDGYTGTHRTTANNNINTSGQQQEPQQGFSDSDVRRVEKLRRLALEQVQEASQDQFESQRKKTEQDLSSKSAEQWIVCEPLLACSDSWTSLLCPVGVTTSRREQQYEPNEDVDELPHAIIHPPALKRQEEEDVSISVGTVSHAATAATISASPSCTEKDTSTAGSVAGAVTTMATTPTLEDQVAAARVTSVESRIPPSPTRYAEETDQMPVATAFQLVPTSSVQPPGRRLDDHVAVVRTASAVSARQSGSSHVTAMSVQATEDLLLEKALYLSGLEMTHSDVAIVSQSESSAGDLSRPESMTSSSKLELATLKTLYHDDVEQLRRSKRIRTSLVHTYQGRIPESTNGCTVIAPLLCIHHLLETTCPDPGLPDGVICQVIDQETPVILNSLRKSLGLSAQAFLIPSDAHDYLIDHGQLHQSQFVNVVGGNILDDSHLSALVDALTDDQYSHRQLAATLFFHQHVVAVLKLKRLNNVCWFDLLDGLPLKETLRRPHESDFDLARRLGLPLEDDVEAFCPRTTRIRCLDAEALKAMLRWYACSKFGDENMNYIDNYEWNDAQSDFDPRVFQAFVWGDAQ